jgi:N-acetyl-anhydromuramyl-L-alanine amidase AmpD
MTKFLERYKIIQKYIPAYSLRRSCKPIQKVVFVVAHDTGNKDTTALQNVNYYCRTCNNQDNDPNWRNASAHIFVDDTSIIECVPALTGPPEKAWHVLYDVKADNYLYGCDANDSAIGVEYCYGPSINADEAYKRYIWVIAFICSKFQLNIQSAICGHFILDPQRRCDPVSGLSFSRRTYEQMLKDIIYEYDICTGGQEKQFNVIQDTGDKLTTGRLNIRKSSPDTRADIVNTVPSGTVLTHEGYVSDGMAINGNSKWFINKEGNFFWSGGVR